MSRTEALIIARMAIAVLVAAACSAYLASARPHLTVAQVWRRRDQLRGELIAVGGWHEDTVSRHLLLESVWWWEAQQKIDGVWQPMPTGDFVVRLPQQKLAARKAR